MPVEPVQTINHDGATRRTVLKSVGIASGVGLLGAVPSRAAESTGFTISQGGQCVPVVPLSGSDPVEEMYDFRIPYRFTGENGGIQIGRGPYYESLGTVELQRPDTTIAFLYDGPDGLSLVVVHDHVDDDSGGAVTWTLTGLPTAGEWAVQDSYLILRETGEVAEIEKDQWDISGETHTIDWTWGLGSTDGGAFRGLGDSFEVTIHPAYNEAATLWGEVTTGLMSGWQFLSGSWSDPVRVPLALDQPVTISTGACPDESEDEEGDRSGRSEQGKRQQDESKDRRDEREKEREEEKKEREERKEEREKEREEEKKEREERKEEREKEREEEKKEREKEREERKKERKERKEEREDDDDDDDDDEYEDEDDDDEDDDDEYEDEDDDDDDDDDEYEDDDDDDDEYDDDEDDDEDDDDDDD